jgi:hypothetical protein
MHPPKSGRAATLLGPVAEASVVNVPVIYMALAGFTGFYNCDTKNNSMVATLNWGKVDGATGYRLFRNGVSLAGLGASDTTFVDNAPMAVDLAYELEAFNAAGSTVRASVSLPACGF